MKVLDGLRAGKKPREIAVDIYGADEVRDRWYPDSGDALAGAAVDRQGRAP